MRFSVIAFKSYYTPFGDNITESEQIGELQH